MLKLPENFVELSKEEMILIDGGDDLVINLGMNRGYLNKSTCIAQARGIIQKHGWNNVTSTQLAKEIYGHAYVCYNWEFLGNIPKVDEAVYAHVTDGVHVTNKVDDYQFVWDFLWNF